MAKLKLPDAVQEIKNLDLSDTRARAHQLEGPPRPGEATVMPGRHYPEFRLPTVITTAAHLLENRDNQPERRVINCWANPNNVEWTAPRREAFQKVKSGSIRYAWRKRGRTQQAASDKNQESWQTYYDELTVRFTFQSGNILSVPGSINENRVPPGLDDFYLFLGLLNEQKLLEDGRENWHVVIHTSPVFPTILLKGWFTPDGVTWAETSESGFGLQWTATMEVHRTVPPIHNPSELRKMFGVL